MVDPDSGRVPRAPPYSGTASARQIHFAYGALTLFGAPSQTLPLCICFLLTCRVIPMRPYNPAYAVWADPRSLAATCGISGGSLLFLISFPELLRWFTSLSLAPAAYFIQLFRCMLLHAGYPIRQSGDQRMFAPSPGLSQLTTAFIAFRLPGIHHKPVFA